MKIFECPKCGGEQIATERRPDGYTSCLTCGHKVLTKDWGFTKKPEVKIKGAVFLTHETDEGPIEVMHGKVYGHPFGPDGDYVRTSKILERIGPRVETMNTIYIMEDE